jgi:pimeloyl-ACP methyl ester carboxylesterase
VGPRCLQPPPALAGRAAGRGVPARVAADADPSGLRRDEHVAGRRTFLGRSGEFLRVVRAFKQAGGLGGIWPDGDVRRAGWDLVLAVNEALSVLGYFEIPNEEDQPPELIWGNDDRLIAWFDEVKFRRQNPDNSRMEPIPDMQQNDLSKRLGL